MSLYTHGNKHQNWVLVIQRLKQKAKTNTSNITCFYALNAGRMKATHQQNRYVPKRQWYSNKVQDIRQGWDFSPSCGSVCHHAHNGSATAQHPRKWIRGTHESSQQCTNNWSIKLLNIRLHSSRVWRELRSFISTIPHTFTLPSRLVPFC